VISYELPQVRREYKSRQVLPQSVEGVDTAGYWAQVFRSNPALAELSLTDCGVLPASCFSFLGARTAMTSLKLSGCGFYYEEPGEEEELVASIRTLTCLDLRGCGLQPPALVASIAQLSRLRTLKLSGKDKDLDVHEYSSRTYDYDGEIGDVLGGAPLERSRPSASVNPPRRSLTSLRWARVPRRSDQQAHRTDTH
jgi:hypothetical protein